MSAAAEHAKWLASQKVHVKQVKVRKALLKELGPELGAQYLQMSSQPTTTAGAAAEYVDTPAPSTARQVSSNSTDHHHQSIPAGAAGVLNSARQDEHVISTARGTLTVTSGGSTSGGGEGQSITAASSPSDLGLGRTNGTAVTATAGGVGGTRGVVGAVPSGTSPAAGTVEPLLSGLRGGGSSSAFNEGLSDVRQGPLDLLVSPEPSPALSASKGSSEAKLQPPRKSSSSSSSAGADPLPMRKLHSFSDDVHYEPSHHHHSTNDYSQPPTSAFPGNKPGRRRSAEVLGGTRVSADDEASALSSAAAAAAAGAGLEGQRKRGSSASAYPSLPANELPVVPLAREDGNDEPPIDSAINRKASSSALPAPVAATVSIASDEEENEAKRALQAAGIAVTPNPHGRVASAAAAGGSSDPQGQVPQPHSFPVTPAPAAASGMPPPPPATGNVSAENVSAAAEVPAPAPAITVTPVPAPPDFAAAATSPLSTETPQAAALIPQQQEEEELLVGDDQQLQLQQQQAETAVIVAQEEPAVADQQQAAVQQFDRLDAFHAPLLSAVSGLPALLPLPSAIVLADGRPLQLEGTPEVPVLGALLGGLQATTRALWQQQQQQMTSGAVNMAAPELATYDPAEGLHLLFDYATGLPSRATRVQLAYCFYLGDMPVGPVQALPTVDTERENAAAAANGGEAAPPMTATGKRPHGHHSSSSGGGYVRALFGQQRVIDGDAADDVILVIEVQRITGTGAGGTADLRSIGWTAVPLFRAYNPASASSSAHSLTSLPMTASGDTVSLASSNASPRFTVFGNFLRLPLFKPPVGVKGISLTSLKSMTPMAGAVYLRMMTHAQLAATVDSGLTAVETTPLLPDLHGLLRQQVALFQQQAQQAPAADQQQAALASAQAATLAMVELETLAGALDGRGAGRPANEADVVVAMAALAPDYGHASLYKSPFEGMPDQPSSTTSTSFVSPVVAAATAPAVPSTTHAPPNCSATAGAGAEARFETIPAGTPLELPPQQSVASASSSSVAPSVNTGSSAAADASQQAGLDAQASTGPITTPSPVAGGGSNSSGSLSGTPIVSPSNSATSAASSAQITFAQTAGTITGPQLPQQQQLAQQQQLLAQQAVALPHIDVTGTASSSASGPLGDGATLSAGGGGGGAATVISAVSFPTASLALPSLPSASTSMVGGGGGGGGVSSSPRAAMSAPSQAAQVQQQQASAENAASSMPEGPFAPVALQLLGCAIDPSDCLASPLRAPARLQVSIRVLHPLAAAAASQSRNAGSPLAGSRSGSNRSSAGAANGAVGHWVHSSLILAPTQPSFAPCVYTWPAGVVTSSLSPRAPAVGTFPSLPLSLPCDLSGGFPPAEQSPNGSVLLPLATNPAHVMIDFAALTPTSGDNEQPVPSSASGGDAAALLTASVSLLDVLQAYNITLLQMAGQEGAAAAANLGPPTLAQAASLLLNPQQQQNASTSDGSSQPSTPVGLLLPLQTRLTLRPSLPASPGSPLPEPAGCTILVRLVTSLPTLTHLIQVAYAADAKVAFDPFPVPIVATSAEEDGSIGSSSTTVDQPAASAPVGTQLVPSAPLSSSLLLLDDDAAGTGAVPGHILPSSLVAGAGGSGKLSASAILPPLGHSQSGALVNVSGDQLLATGSLNVSSGSNSLRRSSIGSTHGGASGSSGKARVISISNSGIGEVTAALAAAQLPPLATQVAQPSALMKTPDTTYLTSPDKPAAAGQQTPPSFGVASAAIAAVPTPQQQSQQQLAQMTSGFPPPMRLASTSSGEQTTQSSSLTNTSTGLTNTSTGLTNASTRVEVTPPLAAQANGGSDRRSASTGTTGSSGQASGSVTSNGAYTPSIDMRELTSVAASSIAGDVVVSSSGNGNGAPPSAQFTVGPRHGASPPHMPPPYAGASGGGTNFLGIAMMQAPPAAATSPSAPPPGPVAPTSSLLQGSNVAAPTAMVPSYAVAAANSLTYTSSSNSGSSSAMAPLSATLGGAASGGVLPTPLSSSSSSAAGFSAVSRDHFSSTTEDEGDGAGLQLAFVDAGARPSPLTPFNLASEDCFDVYVDAARLLPDNLSLSKVVIKLLTPGFEEAAPAVQSVCALSSRATSPRFNLAARYVPAGSAAASREASSLGPLPRIPYVPDLLSPSCSLLLRVDALDKHTHTCVVVGYAILNLFSLPGGSPALQPGVISISASSSSSSSLSSPVASAADLSSSGGGSGVASSVLAVVPLPRGTPVALNTGAFQLPLLASPPPETGPLVCAAMSSAPRVPCATLLVRLQHVPGRLSTPGAGTMMTASGASLIPPALPAPRYSSGAYDSSRCRPSPAEAFLYPLRMDADADAPSVGSLVEQFRTVTGGAGGGVGPLGPGVPLPPSPSAGADALLSWVAARLNSPPVSLLDYSYLVGYEPSAGVCVQIDSVANIGGPLFLPSPNNNNGSGGTTGKAVKHPSVLLKVVHSVFPTGQGGMQYLLSPSGGRGSASRSSSSRTGSSTSRSGTGTVASGGTAGGSTSAAFTLHHDWSSPIGLQSYRDGPVTHSGTPHHPGLCLLVEVKAMRPKLLGGWEVSAYGWGVLPLLDTHGAGYLRQGGFVVPLFEGSPSRAALAALTSARSPAECVAAVTGGLQNTAVASARSAGSVSSSSDKPLAHWMRDGEAVLVRVSDPQLLGLLAPVPPSDYSLAHVPFSAPHYDRYRDAARGAAALLTSAASAGVDVSGASASVEGRMVPRNAKGGAREYEKVLNRLFSEATGIPLPQGALPAAGTAVGTAVGAAAPSSGSLGGLQAHSQSARNVVGSSQQAQQQREVPFGASARF